MNKVLIVASTLILFTGCGGVQKLVKQPYPEIRRYMLNATRETDTASGVGKPVLTMSPITLARQFDSRNFVYSEGGNRWSADFYNEFFINPSANLTQEATEWFERSGLFSEVRLGRPGPGLHLEMKVTELFGDYSDPRAPKAVVRLSFVVKVDNARTVLSGESVQIVPIRAESAENLVEGWNNALSILLAKLEESLRPRAEKM